MTGGATTIPPLTGLGPGLARSRSGVIEPDLARMGLLEASLPTLDASDRAPHAGVYEREQAYFRARFGNAIQGGTPAEEVGRVVVEALERGAPRPWYAPTMLARVKLLLMNHLGDRLLDRILSRMWLGKRSRDRAPGRRPLGRVAGAEVASELERSRRSERFGGARPAVDSPDPGA